MRINRFFFFLFGGILGAVAFWIPSATIGGNNFVLPAILSLGPWPLLAVPYLVLFVLIFAVLVAFFRLFKKTFPVSFADGAWMIAGIYVVLTLLFFFAARAMANGSLLP